MARPRVTAGKSGAATEQRLVFEALLRGYDVSVPVNADSRFDLIINRFRVQVKLIGVRGRDKKGSRQQSVLLKAGFRSRKNYSTGDFDVLGIYDEFLDTWYFLPWSVVRGRKSVTPQALPGRYKNNWSIFEK